MGWIVTYLASIIIKHGQRRALLQTFYPFQEITTSSSSSTPFFWRWQRSFFGCSRSRRHCTLYEQHIQGFAHKCAYSQDHVRFYYFNLSGVASMFLCENDDFTNWRIVEAWSSAAIAAAKMRWIIAREISRCRRPAHSDGCKKKLRWRAVGEEEE